MRVSFAPFGGWQSGWATRSFAQWRLTWFSGYAGTTALVLAPAKPALAQTNLQVMSELKPAEIRKGGRAVKCTGLEIKPKRAANARLVFDPPTDFASLKRFAPPDLHPSSAEHHGALQFAELGEMAERLNAPRLKRGVPARVSGVRIPLSPPTTRKPAARRPSCVAHPVRYCAAPLRISWSI